MRELRLQMAEVEADAFCRSSASIKVVSRSNRSEEDLSRFLYQSIISLRYLMS
jgi:hypothetical protein